MRIAIPLAALTLAATAALADPVEGVWQTPLDDSGHFGHIRIAPCGDAICGTLVRAYDREGRQVESGKIGRQILWDMKPQGGGRYGKGKVWAPDRDKTYNGKMALEGDVLSVSGCVIGICRDGGRWKRVK
ncbi:DUF2147 domain-containing protein [Rhodovulum sp. MB263]|uniref:DUF2147 domain-containing protein n=1 Tax=Rhodovulum sp. (strain MB263) TaxID=308754 RepID=UPI0009B749B0|nr:DUF2147 domain-containing protein [Rhodovulum sp. MB263]ARC89321.1 imidazoleglycerol-phosphate dehydratase [Rhodovulum sp. MB263]